MERLFPAKRVDPPGYNLPIPPKDGGDNHLSSRFLNAEMQRRSVHKANYHKQITYFLSEHDHLLVHVLIFGQSDIQL
jgi:hypothetical protein